MGLLPIFLGGFFVGIYVKSLYDAYKRDMTIDDSTKIHTLEHYIRSLKDDIGMLEAENKSLREKLEEIKK